ncbi:MAG: chromosome segregation protein SMC [Microscillaceae bacterium]|nr:chromosome segregation protein SMC [Microscillaceae bacterium]
MEEGQKTLDHFELALRNKQQLFNNHQAKIRQLENDKKLRAEKLFYLQEKIEKIRAQIQQDLQQQQQVRQSHQQQVQLQTSVEKQWQEAEALISQTEKQHQAQQQKVQELITRLNSREAILRQRQQAILQDQQAFEIKKTQLSAAKQALENTTGQNQRLEEEIQRYDADLNQAQEALQMAKTSLQQLKEKEDRRTEELREMEQKVQAQRELLAETQRALDARQNEYQLTESFLNNLEGYPEAIQYLQQSEAHDLPPMPLLSEVLISEELYRRAIESYLNPWINYYVVATEAEARQAILQLEKAEKGKAHFFILEKLPPPSQPAPSPVDESPLFWGGLDVSVLKPRPEDAPVLALEVVSCDPIHWPLLCLLLQSVWILPHEHFPQIVPEDDYVTRDGRIVRRLYQLTGGSVGAFEGKRLGGSRNLAILQSQIAKLNQDISQQKNDLQFQLANLKSLKENRSLREAYERNLLQVNHINEQYISLRSKKEQLTQVVEGNVSRYEEARERIYLLQEEVEALAPQVRQAQDEIARLQTETEDLRQQYHDEEAQLRTLAAQVNEQKRSFYQLENQFQAQVREGEYQQQQLQTLSRRLAQQGEELKTAEAELESLLENEEDYGSQIDILRAETEDYQRNLQSVEKDYYERRGQRNDQEKNRQTLYKNREQQDEILRRLEQKNHETQLELTSLRERLAAEFNLEAHTMAHSEIPEDLLAREEAALRAEASRIRQKIDNLGTVNPMALSEYETQKERYDFISGQKADLEASKKSLLKTLSETESYARKAFMEAYESIRQNFIQVFRSLFSSEDRADLILAEPDNPLESKIEIIAQPKGKRPLTIDQLSGGEKTLTSTSLLFALYLLKPAPFCIFDEVDAPLDDANTDKFNNIIRDFSKNSQFILVTHNKRTMETTDVLYGVVMPETGVSQVVPVSLRQVEQVLENRLQV